MPYIKSFEEFARQAESLFASSPSSARFVLKYRHQDGKLVAKMTDNHVCIMYLVEKSQEVKKVEKLNSRLIGLMIAESS
jgi:signal recognition particle subunit SRP9